jgi:outer membrane scaffolding protein for murein synthesis (MipA/OmpV family)
MRRALGFAVYLLVAPCGFAAGSAAADGNATLSLSAAANEGAVGAAAVPEKQFVFPGLERLTLNGRQAAGADLFHFGGFRAGTTAALGPDRSGLDISGPIRFGGAEVGAFAEYQFDAFKITANARQNASATGTGSAFAVGFGYGAKLAADVSLAVGPSATWASGRGPGEGPLGLAVGGRSGGSSGLALHDIGASVSVNWQFQDRWQLSGVAGARQVMGDSAFSNETEQGGSTQLFTGVTFGFHF